MWWLVGRDNYDVSCSSWDPEDFSMLQPRCPCFPAMVTASRPSILLSKMGHSSISLKLGGGGLVIAGCCLLAAWA